jgi:hypothetical protein
MDLWINEKHVRETETEKNPKANEILNPAKIFKFSDPSNWEFKPVSSHNYSSYTE